MSKLQLATSLHDCIRLAVETGCQYLDPQMYGSGGWRYGKAKESPEKLFSQLRQDAARCCRPVLGFGRRLLDFGALSGISAQSSSSSDPDALPSCRIAVGDSFASCLVQLGKTIR